MKISNRVSIRGGEQRCTFRIVSNSMERRWRQVEHGSAASKKKTIGGRRLMESQIAINRPLEPAGYPPGGRHRLFRQASVQGGGGRVLMASEILVLLLVPPTRPHPSSVERRRRGKWLQTAPQEPKRHKSPRAY